MKCRRWTAKQPGSCAVVLLQPFGVTLQRRLTHHRHRLFFLSELGRYQAILASPFGSCATMYSGHCVSALRPFMFFFPCLVSFRGILLFVSLVRPGGVHNQRDRGAGRQRRVGRDCHGPARPEGLCLCPRARLTEKSVGWIFGSHLILPPGGYAPQVGSAKVHWYGGILSSVSFAVGRQATCRQMSRRTPSRSVSHPIPVVCRLCCLCEHGYRS